MARGEITVRYTCWGSRPEAKNPSWMLYSGTNGPVGALDLFRNDR
jgi:hypothetical protein